MFQSTSLINDQKNCCWEEAFSSTPVLEYPARVRLFQQGRRAECAYFVSAGIAKLACLSQEGKEVIVGLRGPGSLLGGTAIILNEPHPTTAATLTDCRLARVSTGEFDTQVTLNSRFSRYLHHVHAREVHAHLELLVELVSHPAQYRLTKLLSDLVCGLRSLPMVMDQNLRIPLSQWEIAELLSVTPEHTSRVLRRLEEAGLVLRKGKLLFIPDPKRLNSFIGR